MPAFKKRILPGVLSMAVSACATQVGSGIEILKPPLVMASPAHAEEIVFLVEVRNTGPQAIKSGSYYIRTVAKNFAVNPACQIGASSYGEEIVAIPALQPNQTWKAADKRIVDLPGFKDEKCSCKANQCGGGIMRFTLLNQAKEPYTGSQSDLEVKWDKSGALGKNVVSDESLSQ